LSLVIGGTGYAVSNEFLQQNSDQVIPQPSQEESQPAPEPKPKPKPKPTATTRWCNVLTDQDIFLQRQEMADLMEKRFNYTIEQSPVWPNDPKLAYINSKITKIEELINLKQKC